jgi:hypothetical protein
LKRNASTNHLGRQRPPPAPHTDASRGIHLDPSQERVKPRSASPDKHALSYRTANGSPMRSASANCNTKSPYASPYRQRKREAALSGALVGKTEQDALNSSINSAYAGGGKNSMNVTNSNTSFNGGRATVSKNIWGDGSINGSVVSQSELYHDMFGPGRFSNLDGSSGVGGVTRSYQEFQEWLRTNNDWKKRKEMKVKVIQQEKYDFKPK